MKIIEIRRHSKRDKGSPHLNQEGVSLARKIGENLQTFDKIITSMKERAYDTAIAMGFSVNEQIKELADFDDIELKGIDDFKTLALFLKKDEKLIKCAEKHLNLLETIIEDVQDDTKTLIISHGGIIEGLTIYIFKDKDFSEWGELLSYCEGVIIKYDNGKFINVELIRVS